MENEKKTSMALHIALWIAQVLLAAMFLMAGFMKINSGITELSQQLPWTADVPELLVRFIGVSEFAAGLGLLLPSILRIMPKLTVYAALGLVVIMIMAAIFHIYRGEYAALGFNVVPGLIAFFIYWGRLSKVPIAAKK